MLPADREFLATAQPRQKVSVIYANSPAGEAGGKPHSHERLLLAPIVSRSLVLPEPKFVKMPDWAGGLGPRATDSHDVPRSRPERAAGDPA